MKIINTYNLFCDLYSKDRNLSEILNTRAEFSLLSELLNQWDLNDQDRDNIAAWLNSSEYKAQQKIANGFLEKVPRILEKIQSFFKCDLPGTLILSPSMMHFDGFARFDRGSHTVLFGIDHPDGDESYLSALLAHELSHVYRDHQTDVWSFLGKPIADLSRAEYLENMTAKEHLVSEGLATLFSQIVFPEIPIHVHHYYLEHEMLWCFQNMREIEASIYEELRKEKNVWKFYEEDIVKLGSPSRVQYFWAAQKIQDWLKRDDLFVEKVVRAHGLKAGDVKCF